MPIDTDTTSDFPSSAGDGVKSILIGRAQSESNAAETTYQKVTTALDVTETGVQSVWYLSDDGGDSLNATLPAGTYTRAYVTSTGAVTIDTGVVISGSEDTLRTAAQADVLYINRALTAGETAALTAFWGGLYS